jgi:hypothetical protein
MRPHYRVADLGTAHNSLLKIQNYDRAPISFEEGRTGGEASTSLVTLGPCQRPVKGLSKFSVIAIERERDAATAVVLTVHCASDRPTLPSRCVRPETLRFFFAPYYPVTVARRNRYNIPLPTWTCPHCGFVHHPNAS